MSKHVGGLVKKIEDEEITTEKVQQNCMISWKNCRML